MTVVDAPNDLPEGLVHRGQRLSSPCNPCNTSCQLLATKVAIILTVAHLYQHLPLQRNGSKELSIYIIMSFPNNLIYTHTISAVISSRLIDQLTDIFVNCSYRGVHSSIRFCCAMRVPASRPSFTCFYYNNGRMR